MTKLSFKYIILIELRLEEFKMLVGFTFENFASFYNNTEFAMTVSKSDNRYKELNTFNTPHGELLKSCLMYGANGSGKTNFINALSFMKSVVTSELDVQTKIISSINYFLFNKSSKEKPIKFSISFIVDDVLYDYGFSILDNKITSEYLDKKVQRTTNVFTRSGSGFETIKLNTKDFKNVEHVIKNTREDVLFLSWANFCNNEMAMKIYKWFDDIQIFDADDTSQLLSVTVDYMEQNDNGKEEIINLMHNVGINIEDMELEIKDLEITEFLMSALKKSYKEKFKSMKPRGVDLKVKQKVYDENWENFEMADFGFELESAGTRKLFEIAGPIISAINNGSVVLIDEIDARLHPALVRHLVMMFSSISQNPKNAQLVCNTHDVTLLDEDIRRDQICFLEKNEYGVSDLYCLCDFTGVRKDSKILKQYLLGAYGALPNIKGSKMDV